MRFVFALLWIVAPSMLPGQIPRIGVIDYYGVTKVPLDRVRKALGVREGERLPGSKGSLEERLETVPGVVLSRLEAVCCAGADVILYVGIEERGAPHFEFRDPPHGTAVLPSNITEDYRGFLNAFSRAAAFGNIAEDVSRGHSIAVDREVQRYQMRFVEEAAANVDILRQALRTAEDPEQRAVAAYVIGYAPVKRLVVDDLQYAMQDDDEGVRANAMRALSAIAVLASRDSASEVRVEPTWFIELLNSIYWSDRERAASALVNITEDRRPALMEQLRLRAFDSLVSMARWKTLAHALPAFILVGRLAGLPEHEIQERWTKGDRNAVIQMAQDKKP
jgi:hypothetical protein